MRYSKKNGYRNKYGLTRYEQKQVNSYNKSLKKQKKDKNYNDVSKSNATKSVFAILLLALFVITFSHYIRTGTFTDLTFKGLIDWFSQMPDVSPNFLSVDLTIYGDWGVFNFLRYFINSWSSMLEISFSIIGLVGQALVVIFFLVGILFI